jgi:predicted O-methyltransferase YrrM
MMDGRVGRRENLGVNERVKQRAWGLLPDRLQDVALRSAIRLGAGRFKDTRRTFDYDRNLLPNRYLAELESASPNLETAVKLSGLSIGYPAWNLLYYCLLCSLPRGEAVVVETGTNHGFSTIVMAQALKDGGARGVVRTIDIDPTVVPRAKENVEKAGLTVYVDFEIGDSLDFLRDLVGDHDHIDFAFLDGNHECAHVVKEFEIIHPKVAACGGKVYFDNTASGGVAEALRHIRAGYGGNVVEFGSCSWSPPGNAIWQP